MKLNCSENRFQHYCLFLTLSSLILTGCGGSGKKTVHGTVTCGGEKPNNGYVCFLPVDGTPGPVCSGQINDGEYRIEDRGGVHMGKYRVEVKAGKKTGRQVANTRMLGEKTRVMTDEVVPISPMLYEGKQSPLIIEVTSDNDGRIDIEIPGRK